MSVRPYDEEHAARFGDLAELLFECRQAFRDVAHETNWRPVPGSPAAEDTQKLSQHEPPYPEGTAFKITYLLYFYLSAASEYLGGLGALYTMHEVLIPTGPLERAVLEHCARILWVLQQGDVPVEDRLARAYLEELLSSEEAKKTAGRLEGKESDQYRMEAAKFKALREQATVVFGEPILDEHGQAKLRGQQLIGLEDCVAWMFEFLSRPLSASVGRGVYDLISNISHPTLYTHFQMWTVAEQDGQVTVVSQIGLDDHNARVGIAVVPYYEALGCVMAYYGWPPARLEQLTAALDRLLPGALASSDGCTTT